MLLFNQIYIRLKGPVDLVILGGNFGGASSFGITSCKMGAAGGSSSITVSKKTFLQRSVTFMNHICSNI